MRDTVVTPGDQAYFFPTVPVDGNFLLTSVCFRYDLMSYEDDIDRVIGGFYDMPDAEIEAMSGLADALDKLQPEVQGRVLRWAADRYGVVVTKPAVKKRPDDAAGGDQNAGDGGDSPTFDHFVDLFDRVNPTTDADRALTAAYWFQHVSKQQSWQAQKLNTALKDVGHGVGNITDALTSAQSRRPALVRQMAKSGRSRQARKTYKLTTAGLRHIGDRIGAKHGGAEDAEGADEE